MGERTTRRPDQHGRINEMIGMTLIDLENQGRERFHSILTSRSALTFGTTSFTEFW